MRVMQQHLVGHRSREPRRVEFWRQLARAVAVARPQPRSEHSRVHTPARREADTTLLLATLAAVQLLMFLVLYTLRHLDDNRLTSWQWVFRLEQLPLIVVLLALALLLAVPVSALQLKSGVVLGLSLTAAVLVSALCFAIPEVNIDAARYFVHAQYLHDHGLVAFLRDWGATLSVWTDLPLLPLLYGVVLTAAGESRMGGQLLNTALLAGTVFVTYRAGRELWNKSVGLSSAALLLAFPFLFTQVPLMLVDVGAMFFLALSLSTLIDYLKRGSPMRLWLAAACIALALLSKYSTWALLPVLVLSAGFLPFSTWRQRSKQLARLSLATALLLLPVAIFKFEVLRDQILFLVSYQVPGLQRWEESLVSTFLFQIHPLVTVGALIGAGLAVAKRDARILVVGCVVVILLLLDVRRARYTIVAFPFLALMAGYALALLSAQRVRTYVVASAVLYSLIVAGIGYRGFLSQTSAVNLIQAGAFIDTLPSSSIEVHVLPQMVSQANAAVLAPLLDLSTHKAMRTVLYPRATQSVSDHARATSPVRFSWEFDFGAAKPHDTVSGDGRQPVVVVFSSSDQMWPSALHERLVGYQQIRAFDQSDQVFKFQSMVKVFMVDGGRFAAM